MYRTFSVSDVENALKLYPFGDVDLDVSKWLNEDNFAFRDDRGNFALFELSEPGVYYGHYYFIDRGKKAVDLAVSTLKMFFEIAEVVKGLTPVYHKAALWMNRRLGFKSYGTVPTHLGDHEIVVMTRQEFKDKWL